MISSMDYSKIVLPLIKKTGKAILKTFGKIPTLEKKKEDFLDYVSYVDREAERKIINKLKAKFPSYNFLGEETGFLDNKSAYTWIVDPLDGTSNFIRSLPLFAISIGLISKKNFIFGSVYLPFGDELYFAQKDKGSYLNGERISVSKVKSPDKAVFSYTFGKKVQTRSKAKEALIRLLPVAYKMRDYGCSSLSLSWLAAGRIDAYFGFPQIWDVAAPIVIIRESGGRVTDWEGNELIPSYNSSHLISLLASNGKIHEELLGYLKSD